MRQAASMLGPLTAASASWGWAGLRGFSTAAPAATHSNSKGSNLRGCAEVPLGHAQSDLSPAVCNIKLGRRRDLTLRQDLSLFTPEKKTLAELMKVHYQDVAAFAL